MRHKADELREGMGTGSIINPQHEGPTIKRITENQATRKLDDWAPPEGKRKTPEDFRREKLEKREKGNTGVNASNIHERGS